MKRTRIAQCSHCHISTSCFKLDLRYYCAEDLERARIAYKIQRRESEE